MNWIVHPETLDLTKLKIDLKIDLKIEFRIEFRIEIKTKITGDLIAQVIEGTGLPMKDECSRVFGCWTWSYGEVSCEEWDRIRPIVKERIMALYKKGIIRYASW